MSLALDRMQLVREHDVVTARRRARQIAGLLGFDNQDQARIATGVSEIVRNAIRYARDASIEYHVEGERRPQVLIIQVTDQGPGIEDLESILDGAYRSPTGVGRGIAGARRLMDQFDITTGSAGTTVVMKKLFDPRAVPLTAAGAETLRVALAAQATTNALEEVQQQQRELLLALAEARSRHDELTRLNRELEDTNRGVVALYAELDETADHLRRADEMKSRFLSNMSHEFRTPLNSIRALSGLLLDGVDGPLTDEQQHQVRLIGKATDDLSNLVEDLLDLARIEAGKVEIHVAEFTVADLFSALRGMLRPLLMGDAVTLSFEPPMDVPVLNGDEAKVSQVLRNFISNALKFTERGSVVVSAVRTADGKVEFCVADTGIGIAPEDQERIFEEFVQIRGRLQTRAKGTGLGLPLCRRLAQMLGGGVRVESTPGLGSRFFLTLPVHYTALPEPVIERPASPPSEPWRVPVLIVEDDREMHAYYDRVLRDTPYRAIGAGTLHQASAALERERPGIVILDILLGGDDAWRWLAELKGNPATKAIPVIVVTAVDEERKALTLGADRFVRKPIAKSQLMDLLNQVTASRVLIVDDDATTRYAMRKLLDASDFVVLEATNGEEGLRAAEAAKPHSIVLDLELPDLSGFDVLDRFKAAPRTHDIPVIVATAGDLTDAQRSELDARAYAVLSKRDILGNIVATVTAASNKRL